MQRLFVLLPSLCNLGSGFLMALLGAGPVKAFIRTTTPLSDVATKVAAWAREHGNKTNIKQAISEDCTSEHLPIYHAGCTNDDG